MNPQETDKLRVAWEGMGNTRARRANTANCAPSMLTMHRYVRVHVCTSSIQWEFQTNPDQSSEPTSSNTNVIGAGETSRNEQITSCLGRDGQHARPSCKHRKVCVKHMLTHHHQVRIIVCTVAFQGNIHTNPVHSSEHRVVTTDYGAGGYLNNNPNYELLGK